MPAAQPIYQDYALSIMEVLNSQMEKIHSKIKFKGIGGQVTAMILNRRLHSVELEEISATLRKIESVISRQIWYTIDHPASDRMRILIWTSPKDHD